MSEPPDPAEELRRAAERLEALSAELVAARDDPEAAARLADQALEVSARITRLLPEALERDPDGEGDG